MWKVEKKNSFKSTLMLYKTKIISENEKHKKNLTMIFHAQKLKQNSSENNQLTVHSRKVNLRNALKIFRDFQTY